MNNIKKDSSIYIYMDSTYKISPNGLAEVIIYARERDNRHNTKYFTIKGFNPYFYIPKHADHVPESCKVDRDKVIIDALGREVYKCTVDTPNDIIRYRDGFDWTDEGDIKYDSRYLIDNKIRYAFNSNMQAVESIEPFIPRILYFDIEINNPPDKFPNPEAATYPIATIQCKDNYTGEEVIFSHLITGDKVHACIDERDVLLSFIKYIQRLDFDIFAGWNIINFDLPYIYYRAKRIGVNLSKLSRNFNGKIFCRNEQTDGTYQIKITGRQVFDMLVAYKKFTIFEGQKDSYGLKFISKCYDYPYDDYGAHIGELIASKSYDTIITYCLHDIRALSNIEDKTHMIEFYESLRSITGNKLEETMHNSILITTLILRNDIAPIPTRKFTSPMSTVTYEGATVLTPLVGLHNNVATYDVAALYPNIMLGLNLSPDKNGIVVSTLRDIVNKREEYRTKRLSGDKAAKMIENAYKILANSFYGVIGSPSFRLYNVEIAAKVTEIGRAVNAEMRDEVRLFGKLCITSDTDSCFAKDVSKSEAIELTDKINARLSKYAKDIGSSIAFKVKWEKYYSALLIKAASKGDKPSKKRYVGRLIWEDGKDKDTLHYMGIELKRSDQCIIGKKCLEDFLNMLLFENNPIEAGHIVKRYYNMIKDGMISPYDLSIPKGVSKMNGNDPWVRGIINAKSMGYIIPSSVKPRLLYLRDGEICIDDVFNPTNININYTLMAEKVIMNKMKSYLLSINYNWDSVVNGQTVLDI